jgi:hypothetical protein
MTRAPRFAVSPLLLLLQRVWPPFFLKGGYLEVPGSPFPCGRWCESGDRAHLHASSTPTYRLHCRAALAFSLGQLFMDASRLFPVVQHIWQS